MFTLIRPALVLFSILTLITGLAYPLAVTGIAQLAFPHEANGSLIEKEGRIVGSALIGQSFSSNRYFWSRPSATLPFPNNAMASSGSNHGPLNPALTENITARLHALRKDNLTSTEKVPVDLVTTSGSGLDPHLSVAAVYYQAQRVAHERGLAMENIHKLIQQHVEAPDVGLFGPERINVLKLNLALDKIAAPPSR
jgi:potassium-transporting ATPase KdpC subunit